MELLRDSLNRVGEAMSIVDNLPSILPLLRTAHAGLGDVIKQLEAIISPIADNTIDANSSIDRLNLPTRIKNRLVKVGINTVGMLTNSTEDDLQKLHLGAKSLEEINAKLGESGFQLKK